MQKILQKCAKALPIVLLVSIFLILFGCLSVDQHIKISPDGKSVGRINAQLDLRLFYLDWGISPENFSQADEFFKEEFCANISEALNLTNMTCEIQHTALIISGDMDEEQLNSTIFSKKAGLIYNEYWYMQSKEDFELDLGNLTDEEWQSLRDARANVTWKLIVEMPGTVYETSGRIDGNAVTFDILPMFLEGNLPYAKSIELNLPVFCGIFVVVLIVIAWAATMMKKPAQSSTQLRALQSAQLSLRSPLPRLPPRKPRSA